jgi:hypothetical protein
VRNDHPEHSRVVRCPGNPDPRGRQPRARTRSWRHPARSWASSAEKARCSCKPCHRFCITRSSPGPSDSSCSGTRRQATRRLTTQARTREAQHNEPPLASDGVCPNKRLIDGHLAASLMPKIL